MSFNISAKVYAINNAFFFTKILQIENPGGGTGGYSEVVIHTIWKYLKKPGEGTGPIPISRRFCKKHQYQMDDVFFILNLENKEIELYQHFSLILCYFFFTSKSLENVNFDLLDHFGQLVLTTCVLYDQMHFGGL